MEYTHRVSHSTPDLWETRPPPSSAGRLVLGFLMVLAMLVTVAVTGLWVGAIALSAMGPSVGVKTSPGFPVLLACGAATVVAVLLPVTLELRVHRALRRMDPWARPLHGPVVILCNVACVAALALLAPRVSHVALRSEGDWMVRGRCGPAAGAVRTMVRAVGAKLAGARADPLEAGQARTGGGTCRR